MPNFYGLGKIIFNIILALSWMDYIYTKVEFPAEFYKSTLLLFVLLNPFLMSIYLLDLIQDLTFPRFNATLLRASLISSLVFSILALWGDDFFSDILGVRYASFLIFGGIIFLVIGLRFVFQGSEAIRKMRGDAKHLSGSIALPFMIGPGTVNASILIGAKLPMLFSIISILSAMTISYVSLLLLKYLLDYISHKSSVLVERYIDIVGRISALLIGTIAIDMCMQGIELWAKSFSG